MSHNHHHRIGWIPETDSERDAVREQLERMLASSLFMNSKRCPSFLRYVVERTLAGHADDLKERTLGIEAFGRSPDYDTNLDPVVRTTASEIRKRIAQYYQEPGHESEIRISLPSGSYIPEFQMPAAPAPPVPAPAATAPRRSLVYFLTPAIVLAALLFLFAWFRPWAPQTALDRFWAPILKSSEAVLLCIGQPPNLYNRGDTYSAPPALAQIKAETTLHDLYRMGSHYVALSDATTLSRIAGLLQTNGKTYHIRGKATTTFTDLRDGPVVLIGAFNNDWTMKLTGQLRFNFEKDPLTLTRWIKDQENPAQKAWAVDTALPLMKITEDYALISRVLDPATGRVVVVAAGIASYGTAAAGEFLTTPAYMEEIARQAPPDWQRKNIQIVIATQVISGNSGPPRVLARHFW